MGRLRTKQDPDRYIVERKGNYYYKRRVPAMVAHLDERAPHIRISLKTDDLAQARAMRDMHEIADDELWASLHQGGDADKARARYQALVKRAQALGFVYRPVADLIGASTDEILQRLEAPPKVAVQMLDAALGDLSRPAVTVRGAFAIYKSDIIPHELAGKSKGQKHRWEIGKAYSVDQFVAVVGDLDMTAITRDHAQTFYKHYMARIAPKAGPSTYSANHGNRRMGDMRVLFRSYFTYIGEPNRDNPFSGLSYRERNPLRNRKRPSYPVDFITEKVLVPGALARLNDEARGILLAIIDTGARPSEICNLTAARIFLDAEVPYIAIEPEDDPDDPREIKTDASVRKVPLVGLALAAMRKHPNGFPRYRDKGDRLSAALNKYLKENRLKPEGGRHVVYSFRHTFEDRMKDAHVDAELRRILMGHSIDRPEYGEGGSLSLRRAALEKIVLPFDASIV